MVVVMAVADVVQLSILLAESIHDHVEANSVLSHECADLDAVVVQISALVAELGTLLAASSDSRAPSSKSADGSTPPPTPEQDSSLLLAVEKTKLILEDVKSFVTDTTLWQERASCCGKAARSKPALDRLKLLENKLRKQLDLLTQTVSILTQTGAAAAERRKSVTTLLSNPRARAFWVDNFGEQARETSWALFRDALLKECGAVLKGGAGGAAAPPGASDVERLKEHESQLTPAKLDSVLRQGMVGEADTVTVFQMDAVFKEGSVVGILASLLDSFEEAKSVRCCSEGFRRGSTFANTTYTT